VPSQHGIGCIAARCARPSRTPCRQRSGSHPRWARTRPPSAAGCSPTRTRPRKQRHTARRVWQRLIEEQGAQVDFGEFRTVIAGIVVKLWMFVLRLSHSGKAVHVAYANRPGSFTGLAVSGR